MNEYICASILSLSSFEHTYIHIHAHAYGPSVLCCVFTLGSICT